MLILILFLIVIEISSLSSEKSLNIFIAMDFGSSSHIRYILEISEVLIKRGHKVTYLANNITLDFAKHYSDIEKISIGEHKQDQLNTRELTLKMNQEKQDLGVFYNLLSKIIIESYEERLIKILKILDKHKPDLIICTFFFISCIDAAKIRKIPLIVGMCSIDTSPMISPTSYLFENLYTKPITSEGISFFEKFKLAVIDEFWSKYKKTKYVEPLNKIRKSFGLTKMKGLFENVKSSIVISNSFIGFDKPRPLPQNINLIGPIISSKYAELDKDLRKFMNNHKKIVYVAFGSLSMLPQKHITNLISGLYKAYEKGTIDGVLWGLGVLTKDDFPKNIFVDNRKVRLDVLIKDEHPDFRLLLWAPQISILKSKSVKLFVSHGGIDSIFESILNSVPMLIMPYFGDQPRNAYKIREFGNGDFLDPKETNSTEIYNKLDTILTYRCEYIQKRTKAIYLLAKRRTKKDIAADVIESYAHSAKKCKTRSKNSFKKKDCELNISIPVYKRMLFYKSGLLYIYSLIFVSLLMLTHLVFSISKPLISRDKEKQKKQ